MLSAMFDVNQGLSIGSMLVLMLCAAACGLLIAITAMLTGQCSRGFAASLVTLPVVVQAVILMVNGNVATGVAVLGAFSLVRFRSVPGSSRDITLIFLAMGTGLATSMAYTGYALLLTAVVCALLLALHFIHPFSQPLLLRVTIPEDLDYTGVFDDRAAGGWRGSRPPVWAASLSCAIRLSSRTPNRKKPFWMNCAAATETSPCLSRATRPSTKSCDKEAFSHETFLFCSLHASPVHSRVFRRHGRDGG